MMSSTSADVKKRCGNCLEYVKIHITCFICEAAYHIYCWKKVSGAYVNQSGQLFCCHDLTSKYPTTDTNLGTKNNLPERVIEKKNIHGYNEDLKSCPIKVENSEPNEFKCNVFLLEFPDKEHLKNHYSEYPNKEQEFIKELRENKDLKNCLHKEEDLEWNEFNCGACLLEFTSKEHLENHYSKCPNKEGEVIQQLKEDKDFENHLFEEENSKPNEDHLQNHCSSESPNEQKGSIRGLNKDKVGLFCSFPNGENFQKESYQQHVEQCDVESGYSRLNKDNDTSVTNTKRIAAQGDDNEKKYKGIICNYSTHVNGSVVKHMCSRNNEGSFKCDICDCLGKESETSERQLSSKHGGREKCDNKVCASSTPSQDAFRRHPQIHSSERLFKCDTCSFTTAWRSVLTLHMLTKHSNAEKKYKCTDCKYSAYEKSRLVKHKRVHTKERPFKCDTCDYAATQKSTLNTHMLNKHSNAEKRYKCTDCKYSSHDKSSLLKHKRVHTKERPFKCGTCSFTTAWERVLKTHILTKHSNAEKQFKCRDCEYSSYTKPHLVKHMRTHTNERPFKSDYAAGRKSALLSKYKCTDCEYSARDNSSLIKHRYVHTKERPFKCDICDYAASRKFALNSHILSKHSNAEKKYKCTDCEFSTNRKERLVAHKRIHTKERPFKCDTCGFTTAWKDILKSHILTKHSNAEKQFKCGDCAYSAYRKGHLRIHMRIHTHERPFKCGICDYAAAQRVNLNTHILAKHSKVGKVISAQIANIPLKEKSFQ